MLDESIKKPPTRLLKRPQIIGDPPGAGNAILPMSSSSWDRLRREGIAPEPVKLGPRSNAWREDEIHEMIDRLSEERVAS